MNTATATKTSMQMTRESETLLVGTAFGCPRDFLDTRFVYAVVSPRARGLSVGVNMNPDKFCNFDCLGRGGNANAVYCRTVDFPRR